MISTKKFNIGDFVFDIILREKGTVIKIVYNAWDNRYEYLINYKDHGSWNIEQYMTLLPSNRHPLTKIFV